MNTTYNFLSRRDNQIDLIDTMAAVDLGDVSTLGSYGVTANLWSVAGTAKGVPAVRSNLNALLAHGLIAIDGSTVTVTAKGQQCRAAVTRVTDVDRAHSAALVDNAWRDLLAGAAA